MMTEAIEPSHTDAAKKPSGGHRQSRILLVEDNDLNADMLSRRLQRAGFDVIVETTGRSAVSRVPQAKPDLILLDIRLPDFDGHEVARRVRTMTEGRTLPIIALTGDELQEVADEALKAGCTSLLPKPVDFDNLMNEILRLGVHPQANI